MFKSPKPVKVYEALSVLSDQRIEYTSNKTAKVFSSDRSKFYDLAWSEDYLSFYSDDNSSKWQSTLGYPIISILIDREVISNLGDVNFPELSNVNWKALNKAHKNNYEAAAAEVIQDRFADDDRLSELDMIYTKVNSFLKDTDILKSRKADIV